MSPACEAVLLESLDGWLSQRLDIRSCPTSSESGASRCCPRTRAAKGIHFATLGRSSRASSTGPGPGSRGAICPATVRHMADGMEAPLSLRSARSLGPSPCRTQSEGRRGRRHRLDVLRGLDDQLCPPARDGRHSSRPAHRGRERTARIWPLRNPRGTRSAGHVAGWAARSMLWLTAMACRWRSC